MPNVQHVCRWNYLYASVFFLEKLLERLYFVINLHKAFDWIKVKLDWHIILSLNDYMDCAGVKDHYCLCELKQLDNFFLE